jgi:hypothetical protein
MKAISFGEVRKGDVVCKRIDQPHEVDRVFRFKGNPSVLNLHCTDEAMLSGKPEDVIGLLHRPWPEGATERNAWACIELFILLVLAVRKTSLRLAPYLGSLCEAIETYELGKPLNNSEK